MKRNTWIWVSLGLSALAGGIWIQYAVRSHNDEAEFQEQLRLARAEGLPTNAAELAATIQSAPLEENAAPFYRRLEPEIHSFVNVETVSIALARAPTEAHINAARSMVARAANILKTADEAAAKPRCWFDRNWTEGAALVFTEYPDMKSAAKLILLRSSTASAEGHYTEALGGAREVFAVSKHAGEEGTQLSALFSLSIYMMAMHALADWAVAHPAIDAYRELLAKAITDVPPVHLRRENRDRLFNILSIIDLYSTEAGRRKLGFKKEDMPVGPQIFAIIFSQPKSRIALVKAERDFWEALKLHGAEPTSRLAQIQQREETALAAFPFANAIIVNTSDPEERENNWKANVIGYQAVL